jgi:hypothetical protein
MLNQNSQGTGDPMYRMVGTFLMLVLAASGLLPQSKTGTTIGQFTLIEPSARSVAMGGAGATSSREAMSSFYNPGVLAALEQSDIQFTYNTWFADITMSNAVAAFRVEGIGTLSAAVTQLSSGEIAVRTVEQPLGTGEQYSVEDLLVGIGYGVQITDRFFCGVQLNYVHESIWHSSVSNVGVNIGTLYQLSAEGLRIGASLVNFGTKGRYSGTDLKIRYDLDPDRYGDNGAIPGEVTTDEYVLPIVFRVGLGYPLKLDEANTLNLAVDALHPSDNTESLDLGGEWVHKRILALRIGYQNLFQQDSELGLTLGAGVAWDGLGNELRFDYAWAAHGRLGSVHRITLGFAL